MRPDAAGGDPERGRDLVGARRPDRHRARRRSLVERLVEQAIEQCRAIDDGLASSGRACGGTASRSAPSSAPRRCSCVRAGVPPPRPVGAAHRLAQRRSGEPVPDRRRRRGTRRFRAARDQTVKATLHGFTAAEATLMIRSDPGAAVRARAARCRRDGAGGVRRRALPRREDDRVLRRVERRAVADLHDGRGRSADRRQAGARVPLPRLHRPAAAHRRSGRRHRGHQGHRGPRSRSRRRWRRRAAACCSNETRSARARRSRPTARSPATSRSTSRASTGSSSMARRARRSTRRRSTRSTCSTDQAPSVRFAKPGRDTQATPVEEVFAEVRADDDFGVKQVQLFYSVNGGAEKTINLFGGAQGAAGSHGEPHDLPRGARASSRATSCPTTRRRPTTTASQGAKTTTSDIYFVQIRPFRTRLQAGAVDGGRRRWRRRRRTAGRPALAAAARDRRGDVQHRPRPGRR